MINFCGRTSGREGSIPQTRSYGARGSAGPAGVLQPRGLYQAGWSASAACFLLLCAGLIGCTTAIASVAGEVRVLIYDDADAVRIGAASAPKDLSNVRPGKTSLLVNGERVGREWAPKGRGPWQVGTRTVRGRIAVRVYEGKVQVLNRVGLEPYVASTVGGEMSASWPSHALRAQAVAARTYVLHEAAKHRSSAWDVRATESSQVYRGIEAETVETRAATRATAGEILTFEGEPILAVFHSTAGGRTATAGEVWGLDLPYLRVIEVEEEDDAPHTYWRSVFVQADLVDVLSSAGVSVGVGAMVGLEVTRRTPSGRVERIEVRGLPRREALQGKRLRRVLRGLGLRSTLFDIRTTDEGVAFVGSGHGHGVGMSQWGARALAERGVSYQRILARFYPGTRLEKMRFRKLAAPVTESFDGRNAFNPSAAQLQVSSAR